jgi:hypothetical protein
LPALIEQPIHWGHYRGVTEMESPDRRLGTAAGDAASNFVAVKTFSGDWDYEIGRHTNAICCSAFCLPELPVPSHRNFGYDIMAKGRYRTASTS